MISEYEILKAKYDQLKAELAQVRAENARLKSERNNLTRELKLQKYDARAKATVERSEHIKKLTAERDEYRAECERLQEAIIMVAVKVTRTDVRYEIAQCLKAHEEFRKRMGE